MQNLSPTLQLLFVKFGGKVLIPFAAASEAAGIAVQTARNKRTANEYPIRVQEEGSRLFVHVYDLAAYIDRNRNREIEQKPIIKRRGPRTKKERIEAQRGA